jgi:hypothetical protein
VLNSKLKRKNKSFSQFALEWKKNKNATLNKKKVTL